MILKYIYLSIYLVGVVHPEDVPLELLGVCPGVTFLHHAVERLARDPTVRVKLQEVLVPTLHLNFSEGSVLGNEFEVLVGEDGGGVDTAHGVAAAVAAHILTPPM